DSGLSVQLCPARERLSRVAPKPHQLLSFCRNRSDGAVPIRAQRMRMQLRLSATADLWPFRDVEGNANLHPCQPPWHGMQLCSVLRHDAGTRYRGRSWLFCPMNNTHCSARTRVRYSTFFLKSGRVSSRLLASLPWMRAR